LKDSTMRLESPMHNSRTPSLLAGLLGVGLVLALCAPVASAATTPPPPELKAIDELKGADDGDINITWQMAFMSIDRPGGIKSAINPGGPWGIRWNVYIQQTGELANSTTWAPYPADDYETGVRTFHPSSALFFNNHGDVNETRYCIRMQAYQGDGTTAGSTFSAESNTKCVGTQKILIVTPADGPSPFDPPAAAPPPPTKPDLEITRATGPTNVADGVSAVYEVALWNNGTPANNTAQVLIGILGPLEPVAMLDTPDGFTCELGQYGYTCKGSLGGFDEPVQVRGALFRVQVRGNGAGSAAVYGSANHDRTLDEVTIDNNLKLVDVTVK
jgi:hypothetical protein